MTRRKARSDGLRISAWQARQDARARIFFRRHSLSSRSYLVVLGVQARFPDSRLERVCRAAFPVLPNE
jgi:hypothetical protein